MIRPYYQAIYELNFEELLGFYSSNRRQLNKKTFFMGTTLLVHLSSTHQLLATSILGLISLSSQLTLKFNKYSKKFFLIIDSDFKINGKKISKYAL